MLLVTAGMARGLISSGYSKVLVSATATKFTPNSYHAISFFRQGGGEVGSRRVLADAALSIHRDFSHRFLLSGAFLHISLLDIHTAGK